MKLWHCLMINERSEDQKFIGACKSDILCVPFHQSFKYSNFDQAYNPMIMDCGALGVKDNVFTSYMINI